MTLIYRVQSRVCVVPFNKPSIFAVTDDQVDAFDDVDELIDENLLCQGLGWIIRQAKLVHNKQKNPSRETHAESSV